MRFLLVDSIVELDPGRRATGIKNVTLSEDFLADHFPHRPIMPGMMIIESLVQLSDWVIRSGSNFERLGLACGFDRIKFRKVVRPGDQLRLDVQVAAQNDATTTTQAKAYCLDRLVASADITLALHPIADYLDPDEARRLFEALRVEPVAEPT
jgi:3-hydroxyacyl-[acyl-carrier-protein] dehydratase